MKSNMKRGPRTTGLKQAKAEALKANLHSLWDALNKSAANTPVTLESVSPSEEMA